jgi:hypothetical protein
MSAADRQPPSHWFTALWFSHPTSKHGLFLLITCMICMPFAREYIFIFAVVAEN